MGLNKHSETKVHVFHEPFEFETPYMARPEIIPVLEVGYEHWGDPRNPAVLVCHALTMNTHATDLKHPDDSKKSWWNAMVGPGRPIDTDRYFVVCIAMLGGCGGTSGPASINPDTGELYGLHFPVVNVSDIVRSQRMMLDQLGVKRLHAVIGGSLGGFQALVWAVQYPDFVDNCILIGSGAYSNQFQIMTNRAQIDAIQLDANYALGRYKPGHEPVNGVAIAREIGFCTFISPLMMEKKFAKYHASLRAPAADADFHLQRFHEAENYLRQVSQSFSHDFDANSMIYLLQTWSHFDLAVRFGSLAKAFEPIQARTLVIAATGDNLFPPYLSEDILQAMEVHNKPIRYELIEEEYGHDYFLIGEIISEKLAPVLDDFLNHG